MVNSCLDVITLHVPAISYFPVACEKSAINMTTKRATLRRGKSKRAKTTAKSTDTRAKRKAITERRMAAEAAKVVAEIKAATKPTASKKPKKKSAAKAAPKKG